MSNNSLGILLIVSGPSGSGKTTLCRRAADEGLAFYSVSCTTRPPRTGEVDGRDYHFISQTDFNLHISAGDFLEYASVHDHSYGTLQSDVLHHLTQGHNVVMDIDIQGAASVRSCPNPLIQSAYRDVFIYLPLPEIEARLRNRRTDSESSIRLRLHNAVLENSHRSEYQFTITSRSRTHDYLLFKKLLQKDITP